MTMEATVAAEEMLSQFQANLSSSTLSAPAPMSYEIALIQTKRRRRPNT